MKRTLLLFFLIVMCLSTAQPITATYVYQVFLPLVAVNTEASPTEPAIFCIENEDTNYNTYLTDRHLWGYLAASVQLELYRRNPQYFEDKIGAPENVEVLKVKGAYEFWTNPTCGPVPTYFWGAYADFIREILLLLPNVKITEIGNEPDTSATFAEFYFGCWGETYAEGVYYGEFVNFIYAELKPDFPNIIFIGGAFMNARSEFAAGALSVLRPDGISFHNYPWCGEHNHYDELLASLHATTDLPLYLSETGYLYHDEDAEICEPLQADFITSQSQNSDVEMVCQYTLGCRPGWDWNNSSIWGIVPGETRRFYVGQYAARFLVEDGCIRKPAVDAYERIER